MEWIKHVNKDRWRHSRCMRTMNESRWKRSSAPTSEKPADLQVQVLRPSEQDVLSVLAADIYTRPYDSSV